jgi:glyoxylase-like metal-dependent hydrolase (beta-lactamase superfamily II)
MEAGGLDLPYDLVLLPGPNEPNSSLDKTSKGLDREMYFAPDFVFLIEHLATGNKYIFDLGMRKDLENSTPAVIESTLPNFRCTPVSPVDILKMHGTAAQKPSAIKAVIFSHLHFDHTGDFGKSGFNKAELWIGPSACTLFRPGYPADQKGTVFSEDLPNDGSKKIVEFELPARLMDEKRRLAVHDASKNGKYEGIRLHKPAGGWFGLGAFDAGFDLFNDGSAFIIDAPGHTAGHQMLLLRVKVHSTSDADDFILLAGDCYHHPDLLRDPLRTARPPFSKSSMHSEPEHAINTMFRTRKFGEKDNIWVVGAHDFKVKSAVSPNTDAVEGLVLLTDWRENGWKHQ